MKSKTKVLRTVFEITSEKSTVIEFGDNYMTRGPITITFYRIQSSKKVRKGEVNGDIPVSRGLGRGSAVARLLGLRVRTPHRSWMSVSVVFCQAEVSTSVWSLV
jgi:hypothetical protein